MPQWRDRGCRALGRQGGAAAGRPGPARTRPAGGRAHCRALRRQAAGRSLSHPPGARRRPAAGRAHRLPGRAGRRAAGRHRAPDPGGCQGAGILLRLPRARRATWCPTAARVHTLATPAQDALASLEKLADALGADAGARPRCSPRCVPAVRAASSPRRKSARPWATCCPRTPSSIDEAITSGLMLSGHDRRRAAPRPHHADRRRHRPGPAECHRRRHRLPGPPGAGADRRRHARCTPSRRCGPWRARNSTSPSIIFNNASYSVLNVELERVGAERRPARRRGRNSTCTAPVLDFARMAQGMGVHAVRADNGRGFRQGARVRAGQPRART